MWILGKRGISAGQSGIPTHPQLWINRWIMWRSRSGAGCGESFPHGKLSRRGLPPRLSPSVERAKCPNLSLATSLLTDSVGELGDLVVDRATLSHELADLSIGMHHGGVVATTKGLADFWQ